MNETLMIPTSKILEFNLSGIQSKQEFKNYILDLPNPYFQDEALFQSSSNTFSLRYDEQSNGWFNLTPERAVYAFDCTTPKSIKLSFTYSEANLSMMYWAITFYGEKLYCPLNIQDSGSNSRVSDHFVFTNNILNEFYVMSQTNYKTGYSFSNFSFEWINDGFIQPGNYRCYVFNYRYFLPQNRRGEGNPVYFKYLTIEF